MQNTKKVGRGNGDHAEKNSKLHGRSQYRYIKCTLQHIVHSVLFSNWQGASICQTFWNSQLLGPHKVPTDLLFPVAPLDGSLTWSVYGQVGLRSGSEKSRQLYPFHKAPDTKGQISNPDGMLHSDTEHATAPLKITDSIHSRLLRDWWKGCHGDKATRGGHRTVELKGCHWTQQAHGTSKPQDSCVPLCFFFFNHHSPVLSSWD